VGIGVPMNGIGLKSPLPHAEQGDTHVALVL
jgi:hypothetical protein